jgi:Fe-S cluster biogenesis protein NfuA
LAPSRIGLDPEGLSMSDAKSPAPTPAASAPAAAPTDEEKIRAILEEIRPYLQRDGGDCEFVGYENRIVKLRLHGACGSCPSSLMTLRMGIENAIRDQVPDVQAVENVDQPMGMEHEYGHGHSHGAYG